MIDREPGDLIGKPDRANKYKSIALAERQGGNGGEGCERYGARKAKAEDNARQNKQSNPERLAPRGRGRWRCHGLSFANRACVQLVGPNSDMLQLISTEIRCHCFGDDGPRYITIETGQFA